MSMQYCDKCHNIIDTDFDVEHFTEGCPLDELIDDKIKQDIQEDLISQEEYEE